MVRPGYLFSWSSDSSKTVYMSIVDRIVFLVSREGDIGKRIAELRSTNPSITYTVSGIDISPSGHLLALTVNKNDHSDNLYAPMLYIYDLDNEEYIYRCPIYGADTGAPWGVYWSPDGNYIVPFLTDWHMPLKF